jgi:pimeloyl-ACP methyl ester carboxylesterase
MVNLRAGIRCLAACLIVLEVLLVAQRASAQAPTAGKSPAPAARRLPPPQNVALKPTADGVQLAATFYPSPLEKEQKDQAKEAVPVILLHQFKGSRADYENLAVELQKLNCAVLVPDLRGHGQSTKRVMSDGKEKTIDPALLNKQDFEAMVDVGNDLEVCKSFLMEKNNAKQLNIDKLCVVGAEMGAALAVNWADRDWKWPVLTTGKQGQDVKALVLLSPTWSFKGLAIAPAATNRDFTGKLSWLIVVGDQGTKEPGEAKRLKQALEHAVSVNAPAGSAKLDYREMKTSLQGTKLLSIGNLASEIAKFIDQQVGKSTHPWTDRKSPI